MADNFFQLVKINSDCHQLLLFLPKFRKYISFILDKCDLKDIS